MNTSVNEPGNYRGVVVLIPCLNEEKTVGKVVADFKTALPGAEIFVYDNNSTDNTAALARDNGATVIHAPRPGKGNVVKQMFEEVEGDVYVMVDGDDTYPAAFAPGLIAEFNQSGADMVVGARTSYEQRSFRPFHQFGNRLVTGLITRLFCAKLTDVMSGYRVFSRNFVKSIPLMSEGFTIETEMTLQALAKNFVIREIPIQYGKRPEGSHSKLNTYRDGYRVLKTIFFTFKDYKPLQFFSGLSLLLLLLGIIAGIWPLEDYLATGKATHIFWAILAAGAAILAVLSLGLGLILGTISKYHQEKYLLMKRLLSDKVKK